MMKVKVLEDFELYGRRFYAGQIIEVAPEVYELIKDKVEKLEDENAEQV
jgi:hypothetical protein